MKNELERVRQALENDRKLLRTGMLALSALRDSGWEQSRTAFPIDVEALRRVRIGGDGCGSILKEVIATAKTSQPSLHDMEHAIPRPARFAI